MFLTCCRSISTTAQIGIATKRGSGGASRVLMTFGAGCLLPQLPARLVGNTSSIEGVRAAINHHAKEGFHRGLVRVVLPARGPARDQWLSRQQAAIATDRERDLS